MYKKFTAVEWKKILGLPEDYKISGFIINGTWNVEDAFSTYKKNLDTLGIKYEVRTLETF
ncbi:MAG: hypothetical protein WCJ59_01480 [bacterium]